MAQQTSKNRVSTITRWAIILFALILTLTIAFMIGASLRGDVVMIVSGRGGMCPSGPCNYDQYKLFESGEFEYHQNLDRSELDRLEEIISKPGFEDMNPSSYQIFCDSFVDGRDLVLTFPQKYGAKEFIPCEMSPRQKLADGSYTDPDIAYIVSLIRSDD